MVPGCPQGLLAQGVLTGFARSAAEPFRQAAAL